MEKWKVHFQEMEWNIQIQMAGGAGEAGQEKCRQVERECREGKGWERARAAIHQKWTLIGKGKEEARGAQEKGERFRSGYIRTLFQEAEPDAWATEREEAMGE